MTNENSFPFRVPSFIGLEQLLSELDTLGRAKEVNFPSYNLVKENDNDYRIEMALAGYRREDVSITVEKNKLVVSSDGVDDQETSSSFLHRGIAKRSFVRKFRLHENIVVEGADFTDGMLYIYLTMVVPESEKPRYIEIGATRPQLLTEGNDNE